MLRKQIACGLAAAVVLNLCLAAAAAEDEKTVEVKLSDNASLTVPAAWTKQEPTSSMRKAQFSIAAAEGDKSPAELVVFSFGGPAGGVDANVTRWINQFDAKDRKSTVTSGETKTGKYVVAEISGTYNMPVGPPIAGQSKAVPGSRVINVMFTSGEEVYFLKLAGGDKTVAAAADALRASFGGDKSKEKEYKAPE